MEISPYIIIGSGPCALIAAKTLIDQDALVCMLDVGIEGKNKFNSEFKNFLQIRESEESQETLFLGENYESLEVINRSNPIHLTPEKKFTIARIEGVNVWNSLNFNPIESLSKGGLANAWGLGAFVFSKNEMQQAGLDPYKMEKAYKWVADYIGISGGTDEASEYSNGGYFTPQEPMQMDFSGDSLFKKYQRRKKVLTKNGFMLGRTPLAINTSARNGREAFAGTDLDFHTEVNNSAFRPGVTLQELLKNKNFTYIPSQLVTRFAENSERVEIETIDMTNHANNIFYAKKLIVAAGALGSARIIMRSTGIEQLPVICNPYTYIPSLQLSLVGSPNRTYQTGLAQLSLYYDPERDHRHVAMGSVYSYRSLLNFRLLKEMPFDHKNSLRLLKLIMPALNITGLFHPEYGSKDKYIRLEKDQNSITGDSISSNYELTQAESKKLETTEKAYCKALRLLGAYPIKVLRNMHGASIHYGGTTPFSSDPVPGTISPEGKLHGFSAVYVADGSGFKFLPGKGVTLSIMANAHLTAQYAFEH
jgi:choline dehydrogenase-like flavoprotein